MQDVNSTISDLAVSVLVVEEMFFVFFPRGLCYSSSEMSSTV